MWAQNGNTAIVPPEPQLGHDGAAEGRGLGRWLPRPLSTRVCGPVPALVLAVARARCRWAEGLVVQLPDSRRAANAGADSLGAP